MSDEAKSKAERVKAAMELLPRSAVLHCILSVEEVREVAALLGQTVEATLHLGSGPRPSVIEVVVMTHNGIHATFQGSRPPTPEDTSLYIHVSGSHRSGTREEAEQALRAAAKDGGAL